MPQNIFDDKLKMVQVMAWCRRLGPITWANVDPDLCRHLVSPGVKLYRLLGKNIFKIIDNKTNFEEMMLLFVVNTVDICTQCNDHVLSRIYCDYVTAKSES